MTSSPPPHDDPWLASLRSRLEAVRGIPREEEPLDPARTHAAVSLVLRTGPGPELLLIRRAEAEGDPWSGHMALPGGRRDPTDPTLLHTAVRETREETGLCLSGEGTVLGRLDTVAPATRHLPPISIHPFVFGVPEGTPARAASPEVAEVLWAPLSALRCPSVADSVDVPLGELTRTFPCLRVGERVVWGLTYRILTGFFQLL